MKKLLLFCVISLMTVFVAKADNDPMPIFSTSENPTYYIVSFASAPTIYFQDNGSDAEISLSTRAAVPADAQQWRFEETAPGSGTFLMISKLGNQVYNNNVAYDRYCTGVTGDVLDFVYSESATYPGKLVIGVAPGAITAMETAGTKIGGANSAIAGDGSPLIIIPVDAKSLLADKIATTTILHDAQITGANPGQLSQAAVDQLAADIATAQAVLDDELSTDTDYDDAQIALFTAIETFNNAESNPIKYSTEGDETWYKIVNAKVGDDRGGKCIQAGAINDPVFLVEDDDSDALLWKIIDNGDGTTKIISKLNGGQIKAPLDNTERKEQRLLLDVDQFYKIASVGEDQFYIKGYVNSADTYMLSANIDGETFILIAYTPAYSPLNYQMAWRFQEVAVSTVPTLVDNQSVNEIKIGVTNQMIFVKGTTAPVRAFTASGVEVDTTKALKQGVYIVKVAGLTTKVLVQ